MVKRDYDGEPFIPAEHLEGSLIKAGASFKMKGRKTFKDFAKACLLVVEREIPFDDDQPHSWVIDERPVVISRSRVLCWRPRWDKWSCHFTVRNLGTDMMDRAIFLDILKNAGMFVGIGDFRPKFGRFEVISCKTKPQEKNQPYEDYEVAIRGVAPLLHHKFTTDKSKKRKTTYIPRQEAISGLYLRQSGKVGHS